MITGAIIGPLLVFLDLSRFLLRSYDVKATSNLLFVLSFMQFQLNCVTSCFFVSAASFLFICVIKFLVTLELLHSQE